MASSSHEKQGEVGDSIAGRKKARVEELKGPMAVTGKRHCTQHYVELVEEDFVAPDPPDEYAMRAINMARLLERYPNLRDATRGDILVDLTTAGYRSTGMSHIEVVGGEIVHEPLDYELADDYGAPSLKFSILDDFPADYWDVSDVIDHTGAGRSTNGVASEQVSWHSGEGPAIIMQPKRFGLDLKAADFEQLPENLQLIRFTAGKNACAFLRVADEYDDPTHEHKVVTLMEGHIREVMCPDVEPGFAVQGDVYVRPETLQKIAESSLMVKAAHKTH